MRWKPQEKVYTSAKAITLHPSLWHCFLCDEWSRRPGIISDSTEPSVENVRLTVALFSVIGREEARFGQKASSLDRTLPIRFAANHVAGCVQSPLYVAEFQFRYNNLENEDIFGTAITGC